MNPFTFDFTTIDWRVVLAALAIIVTIVIAFYSVWWRNRKSLSYEVLSDVELVSSEKIRDKIEIRYEGKPVESVQLVVVKLINDGYQPIKKDEFEKPVQFIFSEAKILTAEKEKFHPENISTSITYEDHRVEVSPALFNRKDYIQFKVILTGSTEMESDARIVGVPRVSKKKDREVWRLIITASVTAIIAAVVPLTLLTPHLSPKRVMSVTLFILLLVAIVPAIFQFATRQLGR